MLLSQLLGVAVAAVVILARDASAVALRDASAVTLRSHSAGMWDAGGFVKSLGNSIVGAAESCIGNNFDPFRCLSHGAKAVTRDANLFGSITNLDRTKNWQTLMAGVESTSAYIDTRLQSDLVWIGQQIADGMCKTDIGRSATILSCSFALSAAVCAATSGAGPGCFPETMTRYNKVGTMIGMGALQMGIQCAAFAAIRSVPQAPCDGVSWSIATAISSFAVADPYTPICEAILKCSSGAGSTCPFTCNNPLVASTVRANVFAACACCLPD
jgi:hypothetical protein